MDNTKVEDVMTRLVVTLSPEDTINEAAAKLAFNRISGAPVVEEDEVIGMVSESDILQSVAATSPSGGHSILEILFKTRNRHPSHPARGPRVRDAMNSLVIFQVTPQMTIWEAASIMQRRGVKRLPVIDNKGRLCGIISRGDIVRAIGRPDEEIAKDVRATIEILGKDVFEELEVNVLDGVAIIAGEADRKSTKRIALELAKRVPGVFRVKDELSFVSDDVNIKVDFSQRDVENLNPFSHSRGG